MSEAMAAEFDTVATWTAEVALELGAEYYIPAGCRGSGSPAALAWMSDSLALSASDRVLDAGAGVGGPEGNTFVSPAQLPAVIADAGLRIHASVSNATFAPDPEPWQRHLARIDAELDRRHAGQVVWQIAQRQSTIFGQLLATGQIEGTLLVLRPTAYTR